MTYVPPESPDSETCVIPPGHSAINTLQLRVDDDRNEIPEGHLLLRDAFFNPSPIKLNGIEPLLRGFTLSAESAVDTRMVSGASFTIHENFTHFEFCRSSQPLQRLPPPGI